MNMQMPKLPDMEAGWVWLAGGGPGDPGLLTLLAFQALKQADVIVYDALVSDAVLALAHSGAVMEFAGKRGGKPSLQQDDISKRLVVLAQSGKRVLRLKGGDPYVFGRGADEALALVAAAIPFRVVPGVTAGIGGLAYAGIPATARDTNAAITFVTGHSASGDVPDNVDWQALAKASPVIVIYMPLRHVVRIRDIFLDSGRSVDEPVAVVSNASLPNQKVIETTLGQLEADIAAHPMAPPAMLVVGDVVRLRAGLDWLGAMKGKTLTADPLSAVTTLVSNT